MIESELLSIKIFLVKVTLNIGQEKELLSILFWKLILGLFKLKKILGSFYEKESSYSQKNIFFGVSF